MKIARVFPTKTSMSPTGEGIYFGCFPWWVEKYEYDEIHISVTFTWDIERAYEWKEAWELKHDNVKIGGPAIDGESREPFIAGMYLKKGVTITSRGCPNDCEFCLVKQDLKELDDFPAGNIVQDNNILACSWEHLRKVSQMLKTQREIEFKGGLQSALITPNVVDWLRSLRIKTLWLACDSHNALPSLARAVSLLSTGGFNRNKIYCYVLIGKDIAEETERLYEVLRIGCMPFAQLYQPSTSKIYDKEWERFQREWARPAIIRTKIKKEVLE